MLAPPGRVYRLDWLFAPPDEAREAERELFGEFSFDAKVRLGDIAAFYALPVRPRDANLTLGEHFALHYEHTVEVGDRVRLGPSRWLHASSTTIASPRSVSRSKAYSGALARVRAGRARGYSAGSRGACSAGLSPRTRDAAHGLAGRVRCALDFRSFTIVRAADRIRWATYRPPSPRTAPMPPARIRVGGLRAVIEAAAELAAAGVPCVAGVVVDTNGSTYRKRGALILLDATGVRAGALSGGCLEGEVEERARGVLASNTAG